MKFLADGMLGKLARWLRMLGYDVKYFNDLDDNKLLEIAQLEKRILLTRDTQLFRRTPVHGVESFFIKGKIETEQLAEMAQHFSINLMIDINNSRCPKCNTKIQPISKDDAVGGIPQSTLRFYNAFWMCPNCRQIYWQGSHWKKISRTLLQAMQLAEL